MVNQFITPPTALVPNAHEEHSARTKFHTDVQQYMRQYDTAGAASYIDIICNQRQWTPQFLQELNATIHQQLQGLDTAAQYIHSAIENGVEITIYPDYDMDGISAATVLYAGLNELGARANLFIPDYRDERDMTAANVDDMLRYFPNTGCIITCDVGINSNAGIDRAQSQGIPVIVTDHHQENTQGCNAQVIVNPNRRYYTAPFADICGAQVAFEVIRYYTALHRPEKNSDIALLRVFAGIGSQADVMPVVKNNRADINAALTLLRLAYPEVPRDWYGRPKINAVYDRKPSSSTLLDIVQSSQHAPAFTQAFEGLHNYLETLIYNNDLTYIDYISDSTIGFTVAPMFNATRRVEGDIRENFAVFTPSAVHAMYPNDIDERTAPTTLIGYNTQRKESVRASLDLLAHSEQPYAPYIYLIDAPAGILGLLASEMRKVTGKPTVVLNPVTLSGSGRSDNAISILDAAATCAPHVHAAGHPHACGVRVQDENALQLLYSTFDEMVNSAYARGAYHEVEPDLRIIIDPPAHYTRASYDAHFDVTQATQLIEQLDHMRPFGHGFEYPEIICTFNGASITDVACLKKKHLKITLDNGMVFLKWNAAEYVEVATSAIGNPDIHFTVQVELGVNEFRGTTTLQGIIRDIDLEETQAKVDTEINTEINTEITA